MAVKGKKDKFVELFENQANIGLRMSSELSSLLVATDQDQQIMKLRIKVIEEMEHQGDDVLKSIFDLLNRSFITMIEKPDIINLSRSIDDILDLIKEVVVRMRTLELTDPPNIIVIITEKISEAIKDLTHALSILDVISYESICVIREKIESIENEVDELSEKAIGNLYFRAKDLALLKEYLAWKDILEMLEEATDSCQHAINIAVDIVRKEKS